MSELQQLADRLGYADSYLDIFPDVDTITEIYRRLARIAHPDKAGFGEYALASETFKTLNQWKTQAEEMMAEGRYGEPVVMATIRTRKAIHFVKAGRGEDDLAQFFKAQTRMGNGHTGADSYVSMLRVAKSAKDNDLMAAEARALKKLNTEDQLARAYPRLLDTFTHNEGRRRANVTEWIEDTHTLQEIRDMFPTGLDPRHGVWIFRRLLMALGYAHEQGLVHGAVVPSSVIIIPPDHGVMLIDWCYSQVIDEESKTNFIKAVIPMYKALYAPEVFEKEPATPATDLYMAATLMTYLMPVAPKPFRAFFKGVALTKPSMRPQNAWILLHEFDQLLKEIGEPFFPRRWIDFAVPAGVA